jgi:hypothetical protein
MATKRLKRPRDPIQLGKLIVDIATGQVEDRENDNVSDVAATERGHRAGLEGGRRRAMKLSASQRKEIATYAARVRWKDKMPQD